MKVLKGLLAGRFQCQNFWVEHSFSNYQASWTGFVFQKGTVFEHLRVRLFIIPRTLVTFRTQNSFVKCGRAIKTWHWLRFRDINMQSVCTRYFNPSSQMENLSFSTMDSSVFNPLLVVVVILFRKKRTVCKVLKRHFTTYWCDVCFWCSCIVKVFYRLCPTPSHRLSFRLGIGIKLT